MIGTNVLVLPCDSEMWSSSTPQGFLLLKHFYYQQESFAHIQVTDWFRWENMPLNRLISFPCKTDFLLS